MVGGPESNEKYGPNQWTLKEVSTRSKIKKTFGTKWFKTVKWQMYNIYEKYSDVILTRVACFVLLT